MWAVILSVLWFGVREFDAATKWIELVRGLFWIIVACISMYARV